MECRSIINWYSGCRSIINWYSRCRSIINWYSGCRGDRGWQPHRIPFMKTFIWMCKYNFVNVRFIVSLCTCIIIVGLLTVFHCAHGNISNKRVAHKTRVLFVAMYLYIQFGAVLLKGLPWNSNLHTNLKLFSYKYLP